MLRCRVIPRVVGSAVALSAAMLCAAQPPKPSAAASAADEPVACASAGYLTSPADYRTRDSTAQLQWGIQDVNRNHYFPAVERMREGEYSRHVMADLDFLLRHWPNHLPGLEALIQYALAGGKPYEYDPPICYFERASAFVPDDAGVLLLEGYYYWKKGNTSRAIEAYQTALRIDPKSLDAHYNLGLLYFRLGDYREAVAHARAAYGGGYPLPGLKHMLQRSGHWTDPKPQ